MISLTKEQIDNALPLVEPGLNKYLKIQGIFSDLEIDVSKN